MSVIVVASIPAKPESVDFVRETLTKTVPAVHEESGCELYALHEANGTFIFIEQWADMDALQAHSTAPAVIEMFTAISEHVDGQPDIKMAQALPAGDPAKGQLVS